MSPFVPLVVSLWQSCAGYARAPFVAFVPVVIVSPRCASCSSVPSFVPLVVSLWQSCRR